MKNNYFFSLFLEISMYLFNDASGPERTNLEIKRWKSPKNPLENLCPLPGAAGFMSVVNGPHNVHLYDLKYQEHSYKYKIYLSHSTRRRRSEVKWTPKLSFENLFSIPYILLANNGSFHIIMYYTINTTCSRYY